MCNSNTHNTSKRFFAEVILPLAIPKLLSYEIPFDLRQSLREGMRVAVPLGKRKLYVGIVQSIHQSLPDYSTKFIASQIDNAPIVNSHQLKMWQWVADYYMCYLGEVMKAALPAALKMESETHITLCHNEHEAELDEKERTIIQFVEQQLSCTLDEIVQAFGQKAMQIVQGLFEKNILEINELLENPYKARTEDVILLHPNVLNEDLLNDSLQAVARAPQQEKLLLAYLAMAAPMDFAKPKRVDKKALLEKAATNNAVLIACIKKQILTIEKIEVSRLPKDNDDDVAAMPILSSAQQKAFDEIKAHFVEKQVVLLHGVTSSGKTEVYMKLIEEVLTQGKQVLYLVPEIALTTQLINRLKKVFGTVGVYHSKFSDNQRAETYHSLLKNTDKPILILGVRSSIFLPFSNLGLIVVDEEHENTYKQESPAPRYNARDTSIVLAVQQGAKVLLGSATPSLETYSNAQSGKYGWVELSERFGKVQLPEVYPVNTLHLRTKTSGKYFSPRLIKEIDEQLNLQKQVILFQNRRGFSPFIECNECGYIPRCEHCNVSLTYHKYHNQLVCHYCGYSMRNPHNCKSCSGSSLETKGLGTEKIEEELSLIFPKANIARMDLDTTRTRNAYEQIISKFEQGKVDILVGTQMVTKGLDFDHVNLVGILNADAMLSFPDFRAGERSFQLMQQVAGRAGRRSQQGRVLIQTTQVRHPIVRCVVENDYKQVYSLLMQERQDFSYPPFARLIAIRLRHSDEKTLYAAANQIAVQLKEHFGGAILGPEIPLINRIKNRYIIRFLLKIKHGTSLDETKIILKQRFELLTQMPNYKSIEVIFDVDPM
ncbi:MAG: replication restart helicase PriA [Bacteroidales bacterium]